jgi:dTMP kinase
MDDINDSDQPIDRSRQQGVLIVFEGLDGAGTTTQAGLLTTWLSDLGLDVEQTCEPSSGPIGGLTRSALEGRLMVDERALALMFAADRLDHLYNNVNGVISTLARGVTVVSDRYVLSSLAYQAYQGIPIDWLLSINSRALVPDVTIFIDTSVDQCVSRISGRNSRSEMFHDKTKLMHVDRYYRSVLAQGEFIGNLVTADGDQDVMTVAKQVQSGLIELAEQEHNLPLRRLVQPDG